VLDDRKSSILGALVEVYIESAVVAPYEMGGEPAGSIGVLGSTRMDYPQVLATVAVVGRRLGARLTEG